MSSDGGELDEKFHRLSGLIGGQLQWLSSYNIIPRGLIIRLQAWLRKFQEPTTNVVWKKQRNQYAYALYKHLEEVFRPLFEDIRQKPTMSLPQLLPPFDKLPPDGALPNLPKHLTTFLKVLGSNRVPTPKRQRSGVGALANEFFGLQVEDDSRETNRYEQKYRNNLDLKAETQKRRSQGGSSRSGNSSPINGRRSSVHFEDDADSIDTVEALAIAGPGGMSTSDPAEHTVSHWVSSTAGAADDKGRPTTTGTEKLVTLTKDEENELILRAAATERAAEVAATKAERIAEKARCASLRSSIDALLFKIGNDATSSIPPLSPSIPLSLSSSIPLSPSIPPLSSSMAAICARRDDPDAELASYATGREYEDGRVNCSGTAENVRRSLRRAKDVHTAAAVAAAAAYDAVLSTSRVATGDLRRYGLR